MIERVIERFEQKRKDIDLPKERPLNVNPLLRNKPCLLIQEGK